jgi:hypothetical protein
MKARLRTALWIALAAFCIYCAQVAAQDCVPGYISLNSQADVDSFQDAYGPCTHVVTELNIQGNDITNLQGLAGIEGVSGWLAVSNAPLLTDLTGLESLQSVQTLNLVFTGLQNLNGISALSEITDQLILTDNSALDSLSGLPNVIQPMNQVFIFNNAALTSLSGMPTTITQLKTFAIVNNPNLVSLEGAPAITSLSDTISISGNPMLTSLSGLSGINYASGSTEEIQIDISYNDLVTSLDGLPSTDRLLSLSINGNKNLADIGALDGLQEIWDSLEITNNPALNDCSVLSRVFDDVDDSAPGPGPTNPGEPPDIFNLEWAILESNGTGCNSVEEILDGDGNGIFSDGFE